MILISGKRSIIIFISICVGFGLLTTRIAYLTNSKELMEVSKNQSTHTLTISNIRANIYDKNFVNFVNEEKEYKATFMPTIENLDYILEEVDLKYRGQILKNSQKSTPMIITTDENQVQTEDISVFESFKRYSSNQLAEHIIGYIDGSKNGVSGIEKSYNQFLNEHKKTSTISYYKNGVGKGIKDVLPLKDIKDPPTEGVVLTLDANMQKIVERIGSKYIKKGAIVMMDPYTGKILASASFPSYDNNNLEASLNDTENSPMINRAIKQYHVGSVYKLVVVAAALENNISENTVFNCTGSVNVNGQIFKCHYEQGHGYLDMKKAIAESCNPYFIELINKLNIKKLINMTKQFGFDRSYILADGIITDSGTIPSMDDLKNKAEVANLSFGQGKLTATPLQVSLLISSIVNKGKTPIPSLINGLTLDKKTLFRQEQLQPPMLSMSEGTSEKIKKMMIDTVMEGIHQKAKPLSTTAGGKTSTAETGIEKEGRYIYQTWFTGFFPANNPEYVLTIFNQDGESGNESSSPVFREIVDEIFLSK